MAAPIKFGVGQSVLRKEDDTLVRGKGQEPTRLVIFRRPIEHRSTSRDELEALVHTVVVEQLAELLNLTPGQVDERYGD